MTDGIATRIARPLDPLTAVLGRHPVSAYFVLTFALSWGGVLAVVGPGNVPGTPDQVDRLFPLALLALLVGPALAGVSLTALLHGRAGLRTLVTRATRWRVGARWYAVALLTAPLLVVPILLALSWVSPVYLPEVVRTDDVAGLLIGGLVAGVMGGLIEELGWTGFAVPTLRERFSVLVTGLVVGVLWGLWHVLVTLWSSGTASGGIAWELFGPPLVFYVGVLPAYRVLMVWVYDRTESLFVAMVMHLVLTTATLFVLLPPATGTDMVAYYLVLTAAMWVAVAVVLTEGPWSRLSFGGRPT